MVLLAAIVYLAPVAFTACAPHSIWCAIAYGFTSSGGPAGFFALLLVTGLCYTLSVETFWQKGLVFVKSVVSLALFFGVLAFINEHYTKPVLKSQRPSHVFMLTQTRQASAIDSLYALSVEKRKAYFASLVQSNPVTFNDIDPDILEHWIKESGFSFPSGHTFNAFLFSMILAYAIYYNRSRPKMRFLFFAPFIWSVLVGVSRVAVGAHSALDVTAGASLGIIIGTIFLYIDFTRHWLTRKD